MRAVVALVLTAIFAGCAAPVMDQPGNVELSQLPAEAQEFVRLVNEHRESIGLSALQWHSEIADVDLAHSQDMQSRDFFDHENPDGQDPFERLAAAGITYFSAGENIAYGYSTGQAVLTGWLNSDGHKANIENSGYTHHGLGYVEDGHYWTHVFAGNPAVE